MASAKRPATYADIEALPEHVVGELIEGELFVSPRPASLHTLASSRLGRALAPFDEGCRGGTPGGWWILDEPELHFGRNVLIPDLAAWRVERSRSGNGTTAIGRSSAPTPTTKPSSPNPSSKRRSISLRSGRNQSPSPVGAWTGRAAALD